MGEIQKEGARKKITAYLAFVSKMQPMTNIAKPLIVMVENNNASKTSAARKIAQWSIDEVLTQIK